MTSMDAERRRRIDELVEAAAARDAADRAAFLDDACRGDRELRQEVESLVLGASHAERVLASAAWALPALAPGTRLGPHEILALVGSGGMGQVYKARDTRLDRIVALKILPPEVSGDPDRRARFAREAKTISQLNHPHICTLFDIGEAPAPVPDRVGAGFSLRSSGASAGQVSRPDTPDLQYLVMEFLEGETLAARLAKGPVPLAQTLEVGAQVADALAAAHKLGVVHRDLKPGNVMLTRSGVKLLDFGLAKLGPGAGRWALGDGERPHPAATKSEPLTEHGVIVGTLPYMAPEQLEGKPADARTDLWALGTMLYEMLAGKRAFDGDTSANLIGAILEREPEPVATRQPLTPPALDRLVRTCLAKEPDGRWQSASDLAHVLRGIDLAGATSADVPRRRRPMIAIALLPLTIGAALATLAIERLLDRPVRTPPVHMTISLASSGLTLTSGGLAISPDGQTLVFAARAADDPPRLYTRRLDEWESRVLKNTDDAVSPFFSPDGRWVGFVSGGMLQKVPLSGGAAQPICRIVYQGISRAHWAADDQVYFSQWPGGIFSVAAEGGTPRTVLGAPKGLYLKPHLLPDGKTLIFTERQTGGASVRALTPATGAVRTLIESGSHARYLASGHLVYASEGHVRMLPFDLGRVEPGTGSRVVLEDVAIGDVESLAGGGLDFDVSTTGTVAYVPGAMMRTRLVWMDRAGNTAPLGLMTRNYAFPSLSPDGRHVTVTVSEWPSTNVWVGSVDSEPLARLTASSTAMCSVFSPDGAWVAFTSADSGWFNLYRVRADGSGQPQRLQSTEHNQKPTSWSSRDNRLLFNEQLKPDDRDVMAVAVDDADVSRALIKTSANEIEASVSPDGGWVAYQADDYGQWDVYVRAYPGPGPSRRITTDGGMGPVWNPRGGELFYQTRTALMSVRIVDGVVSGPPTKLFSNRKSEDYRREFDVAPDGDRFLFLEATTPRTEIHVITNWFEELKARVGPDRDR